MPVRSNSLAASLRRFVPMSWASSLVVLVLLTVSFTAASAQQAAGAITGAVKDPAGSVIPGALVTVHDVDRGTVWTTHTTSAGLYDFPEITLGNVEVKVEASGFAPERLKSFTLTLNQVARVDFSLKVGDVSDTVTVVDSPPAASNGFHGGRHADRREDGNRSSACDARHQPTHVACSRSREPPTSLRSSLRRRRSGPAGPT